MELPPRGSVNSTTNCQQQMQNVPYKSRSGTVTLFISICVERAKRASSTNTSSCVSEHNYLYIYMYTA